MSVFHSILSDLQKKFSKEADKRADIARLLSEALHVSISPEQVKYKNSSISLQIPPTMKMAVRIKQEELIELLKKHTIPVVSIN